MSKIFKVSKLKPFIFYVSLGLSVYTFADEIENTQLTVEELRIPTALQVMPDVTTRLATQVERFEQQVQQASNYKVLNQLVLLHGPAIWHDAKKSFIELGDYDDRPLYWSRLQMSKILRSSEGFAKLAADQQHKLLWTLELLSRGQTDVKFDKKADKKILITGFDPFFLDKNIDQSNPSGVVALSLDDVVLSIEGKTAEVEALIVPVRFADFDQGMIEELLTPYIAGKDIDMVITVSMGRENFDLERYPALRRSAKAPDNLNVFTGATKSTPLLAKLKSSDLNGPEFVEFSLPIVAMQKGAGKYQVNDNRNVSTLEKSYPAQSLAEIENKTSVSGSGGGYLSNEISYRSILLRERYNPLLPVGHIHTPRIKSFDQRALMDIVNQTKDIITQGVAKL
jgi:pyrrolidone-carboxylate peptidase